MNIGWMDSSKENILIVSELLNDKYVEHPRRF